MSDNEGRVREAMRFLAAEGFTCVKTKSYNQVLRDRDVAIAQRDFTQNEIEGHRRYWQDARAEERRLADRLTYVYGVAMAHGATHEELRQSEKEPAS